MEMGIVGDADVAWEVFDSNMWGARWDALSCEALLALPTPPVSVVEGKGPEKCPGLAQGSLGEVTMGAIPAGVFWLLVIPLSAAPEPLVCKQCGGKEKEVKPEASALAKQEELM